MVVLIQKVPTDFATETTLLGIKDQTDKFAFSVVDDLKVTLDGEVLDVSQSGTWTVGVDNFPTDFPDTTSHSKLDIVKGVLDTIKTVLDTIFSRLGDSSQKTKITDGINDVTVTAENQLKVISQSAGGVLGAVSIVDDRIPGGNKVFISRDHFMNIQSFGSILMRESFETFDIVNRWTEIIVAGGVRNVVNATLELSVGTGATDSVEEFFKQINLAETVGTFGEYRTGVRLGTNNPVGHVKEWGFLSPDKQDGVFFRLKDDVLLAVTRLAGADTEIDIDTFKPDGATFHLHSIEALGAGKIVFLIDGATALDLVPAGGARIGSKIKVPYFRVYNTSAPATTPSKIEHHWVNLVDKSGSRVTVTGVDGNGFVHEVATNSQGRLLISQEPPGTPFGAVAVGETSFGNINGTIDTPFTITNGKKLTITRFVAGAESDSTAGNVIELFEDPNGDLSVLNVLDVIFASGLSDQHDLNAEFIGDGTKRILLRRRRLSGGSKEVFGRWEGFEL